MSIYSQLEHNPIGSIALEPAISVDGATSAREVVLTMRRQSVAHVLVFHDGELAGIFTERDLLMRTVRPDGVPDEPIRQFMTPEPTVVDANMPISKALEPMVRGRYRRLPIRDEVRGFIGVLTSHNLFNFLAELLPDRILNLPPRPHQTLRAPEGA